MSDFENPLTGIEEKTFDQIYDEAKIERPDGSDEQIAMIVDARMTIRQFSIDRDRAQEALQKRVENVALTKKLFEGWKAFQLLKDPNTQDLTETRFRGNFEYLKHRHPLQLLESVLIWETAEQYGAEAALHLDEAHKKQLQQRCNSPIDQKRADHILKFLDVMLDPDE